MRTIPGSYRTALGAFAALALAAGAVWTTTAPTVNAEHAQTPTPSAAPDRITNSSSMAPASPPTITDDDAPLFDFATGARLADGADVAAVADNGYTLLSGVRSNAYRYEVRLIQGGSIESYRGLIQSVAAEINATGSASLTVAPGVFPDPGGKQPANTIYVGSSSSSPCGSGVGIAGCGGAFLGLNRAAPASGAIVMAGRAWILTASDAQSIAWRRVVVAHEIGHTLGLGHYASTYAGQRQVMSPSVVLLPGYQAGDRNGLAYLRGQAPLGNIDSVSSPDDGLAAISGWTFDPDQVAPATFSVTIGGRTVGNLTTTVSRPDVSAAYGITGTRGFNLTVPAPAGPQTVCIVVADFPSGAQVPVYCRSLTVKGNIAPVGNLDSLVQTNRLSVAASGWALDRDTADPITVTVTLDGVPTTAATTIARPDVNKAYNTSGTHGFVITTPTTTPGPHTVCLTIDNYPDGPDGSLGCRTITIDNYAPGAVWQSGPKQVDKAPARTDVTPTPSPGATTSPAP